MKKTYMPVLCVMILLILVCLAGSAMAGASDLTVATEGEGIAVYASSTSRKQIGVLYNGYTDSISLNSTNGRFDCFLTLDYTVWLDAEKAENRLPSKSGFSSHDEWLENLPCNIFLGEIVRDGTPVFSTPQHKHESGRHAEGTLVRVSGVFGNDYYVEGDVYGFVSRDAIRKVADMTFPQAHSKTYIYDDLPVRMLYASATEPVIPAQTATGYTDDPGSMRYTSNREVTVLRELGDWVQLAGDGFVEKRFLDPDGDHSYPVAYVKTDGRFDRLNIRSHADKEANSELKLCSGTPVHVISHTDEWAVVFISGANGGYSRVACALMKYLSSEDGASVTDGSTQTVLTEELTGDSQMINFREKGNGGTLPAGTPLVVVGVFQGGTSNADQVERFLCETEDGKYIIVHGQGVLEPVLDTGEFAAVRSTVRMRVAPNPDAEVICRVKTKAKVEILLRGEIWTTVKYKNQTGYIMSRYLSFP